MACDTEKIESMSRALIFRSTFQIALLGFLICSGQESLFGAVNPKSRTAVAVIELEAKKGVDPSLASLMTDSLRSHIYKGEIFELMNREDMDSILKEIKFQQSGACDTTACVVEMGQALGVEKMIAGSVGKFGKRYAVTLKLLNIAKAKNDLYITEYFEGRDEDLPEFIGSLAKQVIDRESSLKGIKIVQTKTRAKKIKKKRTPKVKKIKEKRVAREKTKTSGTRSPVVAGLLGILPGAGQFYNKQTIKGYVFAGAEVIALAGTLYSFSQSKEAEDTYAAAVVGDDFDGLFNASETKWRLNKLLVISTTSIIGLSVIDAIIFSGKKTGLASLDVRPGSVLLSYAIGF